MKTFFTLLVFFAFALHGAAQNLCEQAFAVTDRDCYLAGERLCVRVDVLLTDLTPSPSKVAYVEIADHRQLYAQAMVALSEGQGWAEIALPERMHSGCYQLTVYTRAMQNFGSDVFFRGSIGLINGEQLSRQDNVRILPYAQYSLGKDASSSLIEDAHYAPGDEVHVSLPACNAQGCAVSVSREGVTTHLEQGRLSPPAVQAALSDGLAVASGRQRGLRYIPELEGHILRANVSRGIEAAVEQSRLAMVGKMASLYDGQPQPDGSYLYFTSGIYGNLPVMVNAFDTLGLAVPMTLVSPYAVSLPQVMPLLEVYCQEDELLHRATAARSQALINKQLLTDTLAHSLGFMSVTPRLFYDLDEYTQMNDIQELLVEFVRGVQKRKHHGQTQLYTYQPESHSYARWPALVLLDGMPVYDIDEILQYDAHLVRFVQIYPQLFSFGNSCCQGVISFITRGGRLSNYKLKAGSHLVSYAFPQDHPAFINYTGSPYSSQLWMPAVKTPKVSFPAPSTPGTYRICVQGLDANGVPFRKVTVFEVR